MNTTVLQKLYNKNELADEKGRVYFFDNAKFLLILFVVLAHAISPLKSNYNIIYAMWVFFNIFHMAAFIFISGYLAKSYIGKNGIKAQRLIIYVILYLACQFAVAGFEVFVLQTEINFSLFNARTSLWFLQCLIAWYLMLPILDKFKPSVVMIGSVVFGLIVGFDNQAGQFLSVSRVFSFMPFFFAGYYCNYETIQKVKKRPYKLVGALILAVIFAVLLYDYKIVPSRIITGNYAYSKLGDAYPEAFGWCYRLGFYALAMVMIFSFFAIVPRCKTFFTKYGSKSLQVYILHRFLYLAWLQYEWYNYFDSTLGAAAVVVIAIALTFVLSWKVFSIPFDFIMKLPVTKLYKTNN